MSSIPRRYVKTQFSSYSEQAGTAVVSPATGRVLWLYAAHLVNRAATQSDLAVLKRRTDSDLGFGTVVDANTPDYTAVTAGPVNIFSLVANDGFLVQSTRKFHFISLNITQAQTGTPVYAYEYWNGAAWAALPMLSTPDLTTTGTKIFMFAPPLDWARGTDATVGADPTSANYNIRIRATTAPTQVVIASALPTIGTIIHFMPKLPINGALSLVYREEFPERFEALEELVPYFEVPAAANLVTVKTFQEA